MSLPSNTYVVLEIPPPFAERVLEIRREQRDLFRWSLPAETTITGSGGVGPLVAGQDPERVFRILDRVATATAPITTSFGPVRRFAESDVFYLSFAGDAPLRRLHARLVASGLRFEESPYPFEPHCTLRTRSPILAEEAAALLRERIDGRFTLDVLSLYEMPARGLPEDRFATRLCFLHRASLAGPAER